MSQTIHAGIDVGYGDVKIATSDHRYITFPALTAAVQDTSMLNRAIRDRALDVGGVKYLVGEDARLVRNVREMHVDSDRIHSLDFKLLGLHALQKLDAKRLTVTTGLPVKDFGRHREALARIIRNWHSKDTKVNLQGVVPQPLGTFCDMGNSMGPEIAEMMARGKVAIIDIGSGTTDLIEINEGEFNPATNTSDSFAIGTAHKLIRNQLLIRHNAEFEIGEIPRVIERGEFLSRGRSIRIDKIIKDAKRDVIVNTIAVARRLWGSLDTFSYVLVTGGGAEFLRDELQSYIPAAQLCIPDEPAMANARGFLSLSYEQNRG